MSSQRGNCEKKKAPKYANKTGFKNDLHDTNKRTKVIRELEVTGCCEKCRKVIEWKIKYKKYKPLTQPKRCVKCQNKSVLNAYNIVCMPCASLQQICAKCSDKLSSNQENAETGVATIGPSGAVTTLTSQSDEVTALNSHLDDRRTDIERLNIANKAHGSNSSSDDVRSVGTDCSEEESDDSEDSMINE